jgi:hypothetical protein
LFILKEFYIAKRAFWTNNFYIFPA